MQPQGLQKGYLGGISQGYARGSLDAECWLQSLAETPPRQTGKEAGTTMSDEEKRSPILVAAQIGNAAITVSDEQLGNGYTVGYLRYLLDDASKSLTESEIYEFIMGRLLDVRETDRWNVGVVLGWIAAMQKTREQKKP